MERVEAVPEVRRAPRITWPFERVRAGQAEFLEDARRALAEGAHLLAHAPTGIGKTAVALVAALEVSLEAGHVVLFLTSRQSQHRIAVETVKRLQGKGAPVAAVDLIAKQSMCLQPSAPSVGPAFHAFCDAKVRSRACGFFLRDATAIALAVRQRALHVQELVKASAACGICPHKVAMEAAAGAHVVVCDYNYVFSEIREPFLARLGRPIEDLVLIVDEAHNLPDRIRSHLCGDLSPQDLWRAAGEARFVDAEVAQHLFAVSRSVDRCLSALRGERVARKEEFLEAVEEGLRRLRGRLAYEDFAESVAWAADESNRIGQAASLSEVVEFLRRWKDQEEGILRLVVGGPGGKFAFRLLDPSVLSRRVFERVHATLLMSGTLHPPEMYADLLGIPADRRRIRRYESPFPKENRLLLAHPHITTLYARRTADMYDLMAREVAAIASAVPGNVAAFFPSYEILAECLERIRRLGGDKRLLVERPDWDKARRDGALVALRLARADGPGALLLGVQGGSLSEGVDYEDNLLAAVLVVGLPLSPPNVEVEALKDYYAKKFGPSKGYDYAYVFPAVNKVLQAAGRPIRSERDRAAIVLLEGRLLTPRYARYLPSDFLPRMADAPAAAIREFLHPSRNAAMAGSG